MSDIYNENKRSEIMSKISGKETKPEILVRKFLFANGFRYKKNVKNLPGKPDIVLPKYKIIIFVHGCFWHGHSCKAGKLPETRKEFWEEKLRSNVERDKINQAKLIELGWKVFIVWQCEIRTRNQRDNRMWNLVNQIIKL
jgi:DNA mismatch endonuclease, patch repair protein